MMKDREIAKLSFKGPATYRICIKGILDEDWTDRLGGKTISTTRMGGREAVTSLHGRLVDQASLLYRCWAGR